MIKEKGLVMKNGMILFNLLLFLFLCSGCAANSYSLEESIDEIERIEIVVAESSQDFRVIRMLTEVEATEFLEEFLNIQFRDYHIGDPMYIHGTAVRIAYKNGDYEMICSFWSEYVKDNEAYFKKVYCEETSFNSIVDSFMK